MVSVRTEEWDGPLLIGRENTINFGISQYLQVVSKTII